MELLYKFRELFFDETGRIYDSDFPKMQIFWILFRFFEILRKSLIWV